MPVDTSEMIDICMLSSAGLDNVDEIITLAKEAETFLNSQEWCGKIVKGEFDRGWGYIVSVFFFTIEPSCEGAPEHIWVITGDLPPAYIDVDDNPNGACALDAYVIEMQRWIDHVMQGKSVNELIPVNTPPTKKYAKMLQQRIEVIGKEILANLKEEIRKGIGALTNN